MRWILKAMLMTVAAIAASPAQSQAAFTTYTTQASYLAAITNPGVDSFQTLSITGTTPSPLSRTTSAGAAYSYNAAATNNFFGAGTSADHWLSTNFATDSIRLSGFSPGVFGVGGFYFGSDVLGAFLPGTSLVLTATDGTTTTTETLTNTTTATFFGFVSSGPITSVTVTPTQGAAPVWATVNDLTLGQAGPPANAVPAPSGLLLGLAGLPALGLAGWARRRRDGLTA